MNKSAREMFEELGYYYRNTGNQIIIFEVWQNGYSELNHNEILRFTKEEKKRWYLRPHNVLRIEYDIPVNLLQAINKQIEELSDCNKEVEE